MAVQTHDVKHSTDGAERMFRGSSFLILGPATLILGPATAKALSPLVFSLERGQVSNNWPQDHRALTHL